MPFTENFSKTTISLFPGLFQDYRLFWDFPGLEILSFEFKELQVCMNAVVITLKQTVKHWSMTSHHRTEKTVCLLMNIPNRPNNGMLHFSLLLSSHIWHVGQNVAGIRNYCTVSSVAKQCMCIKNNYLAINFIWRNHQLGMAKPQLISISTISYLKRKLITKLKKCTAKYGQDNFTRISSFSFPFSTAVPLSNVTVLTDNMAKKTMPTAF